MVLYVILWLAAIGLGGGTVGFFLLGRIEKLEEENKHLKYKCECNDAYINLMTEEALETIENKKLEDKLYVLARENMELLKMLAERR